jgi:hypothetical protein
MSDPTTVVGFESTLYLDDTGEALPGVSSNHSRLEGNDSGVLILGGMA